MISRKMRVLVAVIYSVICLAFTEEMFNAMDTSISIAISPSSHESENPVEL